MQASGSFGGGHRLWFASVLRFCTVAARWKLVARAGEAAETHALEAMVGLQVPRMLALPRLVCD